MIEQARGKVEDTGLEQYVLKLFMIMAWRRKSDWVGNTSQMAGLSDLIPELKLLFWEQNIESEASKC